MYESFIIPFEIKLYKDKLKLNELCYQHKNSYDCLNFYIYKINLLLNEIYKSNNKFFDIVNNKLVNFRFFINKIENIIKLKIIVMENENYDIYNSKQIYFELLAMTSKIINAHIVLFQEIMTEYKKNGIKNNFQDKIISSKKNESHIKNFIIKKRQDFNEHIKRDNINFFVSKDSIGLNLLFSKDLKTNFYENLNEDNFKSFIYLYIKYNLVIYGIYKLDIFPLSLKL